MYYYLVCVQKMFIEFKHYSQCFKMYIDIKYYSQSAKNVY